MLTSLKKFLKPPEYASIARTQKSTFLHYTLLTVSITSVFLGIQNLGGTSNLDIVLFIVSGISLLGIPFNKNGYYTPTALFLTVLILIMATYSLIEGVGLWDAGMITYPIFIIFTSFLFSRNAVWIITLLSLSSVLFVYILSQKGLLTPSQFSESGQLTVIAILLTVTGFLLWLIMKNWERILDDLRDSYDLTLLGWAKALEFRDQGTEGHSQRVVDLTIELAREFGISGYQMSSIRRGALLHDIGKMAIPDSILLKEESLTDEEWEIMKTHPVRAKEMLDRIPFLKSAMEIPYAHHERWDGSGYPQGLKGKEIPLEARIFAVVDVWDALLSDRPYHDAWQKADVIAYLEDNSGKMFDPEITAKFLELVQKS